MGKSYRLDDLREKLTEILRDTKMGLSGVEISKKLDINRITMAKYLGVLSAEGFLRQKNIGNTTLWFLESGQETFRFPNDYFKVASQYLDLLTKGSEAEISSLIKNCIHSEASVHKLVIEVIIPAISHIQSIFDQGKIGNSEARFLGNIISNSLQILYLIPSDLNPKKKIIVLSGDSDNVLLTQAAATSFHSKAWEVINLGDMSSAINVLFDLDFQKLVNKVWKQKSNNLIIIVFANSKERLTFFADSINPLRAKVGKKMNLILCGQVEKKPKFDCDLLTGKFEDVLQWCETKFENLK